MQMKQSQYLTRLQKVNTFFSSRTISNPPTGLADQLTALTAAITKVQNAATTQDDATNYLSRQRKTVRQLRQNLHDEQLIPLYHSAVAMRSDVPGILDHFKIPKISLEENEYVAKLNSIVSRATEFQAQFIAHGAAADFVTTLQNAVTTYTTTSATREQAMQTKKAATEDLGVGLTEGRQAVQHLNAIVHRVYGNDPTTMAVWRQARHVDGLRSSSTTTSPAPAGGTTTGPSATSTQPAVQGTTQSTVQPATQSVAAPAVAATTAVGSAGAHAA